jgi:hypothetical protein
MANPTISVTYDKSTYAPGDLVIATVTIGDPDTRDISDVWTASNPNGDQATITVVKHVVDPVTVTPPAGFTKTSVGNGSPQTWQGVA